MRVMDRRTRHKAELRQQILDAAREVFVNEGYPNVSMRKIAEKIDYSPTTIYLYFRDKSDLLHQLIEATFARLSEAFERITSENPDPLERLRKGLRAYVDFGLHNPNDYKVAFMIEREPVIGRDPLDERSMASKAYSYLCSNVRDCAESGCFREVEIETASQALWATVHGVTALLIVHREFPWVDRDALVDGLIENSIRGYRPEP